MAFDLIPRPQVHKGLLSKYSNWKFLFLLAFISITTSLYSGPYMED